MALQLTPNQPPDNRGALSELAALAWKWEERARRAESKLRRARAFNWAWYIGAAFLGFGFGVVGMALR